MNQSRQPVCARNRLAMPWAAMLVLALVFSVPARSAETGAERPELVFAYWDNASPPFAIREGDQLVGGIIYDIAQHLAARLGVRAVYKLLPPKRIERELIGGGVDLDCVSSPIWKESPDAYPWSPVLFTGADRFLVMKNAGIAINSLGALKGLRVGVYGDYVYHADITSMLDSGVAHRVIVNDLAHGVRLLMAGRIDTLIDFGVLLNYEIKQHSQGDRLMLARFPADQFDLMCAYSVKMKVPKEHVDAQLKSMVKDKIIDQVLAKYRR